MKVKIISVLLFSLLFLAACSSASTPVQTQLPASSPADTQSAYLPPANLPYPAPTQPPASQPAEVSVNISGFKFDPETITVKVGTTVTWTNQDSATHTVTADDGSWASDSLKKGGTYSHVFDQAGTYTYKCSVHPSMVGTIVVQP